MSLIGTQNSTHMARYIIENEFGQNITATVSLSVKAGEIRVIDEQGIDITSSIRILELNADYDAGVKDAKAGIYDKWYRHHRTDDGAMYDKGWKSAKDETKDYQIIEG